MRSTNTGTKSISTFSTGTALPVELLEDIIESTSTLDHVLLAPHRIREPLQVWPTGVNPCVICLMLS